MRILSIFTNTKYSFDGKKDYENVVILLYKHWYILFSYLITSFLLFLIPFIIRWFISGTLLGWGIGPLFDLIIVAYLLVWWLFVFYRITMYLLDTWIVTDHRIIDSEQHGFFSRTVSELNISRVQDVSVEIKGLIPTFFDYGNVEIQTAGTEPKFIFKDIPHPNAVREIIMDTQAKFASSHPGGIEIHNQ